jgi:hypothetical protein
MILRLWRVFFLKPLTEHERRWATLLAVTVERVR